MTHRVQEKLIGPLYTWNKTVGRKVARLSFATVLFVKGLDRIASGSLRMAKRWSSFSIERARPTMVEKNTWARGRHISLAGQLSQMEALIFSSSMTLKKLPLFLCVVLYSCPTLTFFLPFWTKVTFTSELNCQNVFFLLRDATPNLSRGRKGGTPALRLAWHLSAPRGQTLLGTVHAPTPTCITCPSARSLLQASLTTRHDIRVL